MVENASICEVIDLTGSQELEVSQSFINLNLPEDIAGHAGDRFLGKVSLDLIAAESAGYGPADPASVLAAVNAVA
jgi:hypothetical protein